MSNPSDVFSSVKHIEFKPLDIENFVKVNELREIDDPVFFSKNNSPTTRGLLSNEIFGITKDDRTTIFAFINLANTYFLHPFLYKHWCKIDPKVKLCAFEMGKFTYDKSTGRLKEDPNGKTGISYLVSLLKDIKFPNSDSDKRNLRTRYIMTYREKLKMKKLNVIPAGLRDVNTEGNKRIGVGEINKLYNAVIRDCRALEESDDYGLSMTGNLRGKIQEEIVSIYDWFVFGRYNGEESQASGLSRKFGLIRRAGMKKSFDWGFRGVICTQNLRKERLEDIEVDLDSIGIPIAGLCANLFPFIMYWIRRYFENQFSDVEYIMAVNPKTKKTERVSIEDWQIVYSDERIKKEIERFMKGMSNRFIPIEAPIKDLKGNQKSYLMFKGYNIPDEEAAEKIINGTQSVDKSKIYERPLTWCDLIYRAAYEASRDRMSLITRFPMDSYWNQFPAKIKIISTIKTEPMMVDNMVYKEYPYIREQDLNKNTTNKFVDVIVPNNVRLGSIGGDYDGDTTSSKVPYSIEANDELRKVIDSNKHYISLGGINEMTTTNEGLQSLYNLTLVLPDNKDELTANVE